MSIKKAIVLVILVEIVSYFIFRGLIGMNSFLSGYSVGGAVGILGLYIINKSK